MFTQHDMPITRAQIAKLMATGKVHEVENGGMDEGRFFVHLLDGLSYPQPYFGQRTKSFGDYREAAAMLKRVVRA